MDELATSTPERATALHVIAHDGAPDEYGSPHAPAVILRIENADGDSMSVCLDPAALLDAITWAATDLDRD